jgi:hypothetical protein
MCLGAGIQTVQAVRRISDHKNGRRWDKLAKLAATGDVCLMARMLQKPRVKLLVLVRIKNAMLAVGQHGEPNVISQGSQSVAKLSGAAYRGQTIASAMNRPDWYILNPGSPSGRREWVSAHRSN